MEKTFAFIAFNGLEELDLFGPWEFANLWARELGGNVKCLIAAENPGPITCAKGIKLIPDTTFAELKHADYFLVPGGIGTRTEVQNTILIDAIKKYALNAEDILSVCTGAFLLAEAGILYNKNATTHWGSIERLKENNQINVRPERIVRDGNIWTAAGVSSGMDLMLSFIIEKSGREVAAKVQSAAEYYPLPQDLSLCLTADQKPQYLLSLRDHSIKR